MKKIIKFIGIVLILFILSGCQRNIILQYNDISNKHSEKKQTAFNTLSEAIKCYNEQKYNDAIDKAVSCKRIYKEAKELSSQSKEIAKNLKNNKWLIKYKDLSIKTEEIRIKQCQLINEAVNFLKKDDSEKTNEIINEIDQLNNQHNKFFTIMQDIKNQHPDSFK